MILNRVLTLVERVIYRQTGKSLSDLQQAIITKVWEGKKYLEIADEYGCTEGHAKDTGSLLWQELSAAWGKKVTKGNFRSLIKKQLQLLENSDSDRRRNSVNCREKKPQVANFIGRQIAIEDLKDLQQQGNKLIVIQAEGGIGKTTLAQQFLAEDNFSLIIEVLMAKERQNIIAVESVVEEWLTRDFQEESGKELGVSLARLKRCLSLQRVGILIDNLEPALDKDGKFVAEHRNYIELLRILADRNLNSLTIITSRDRLCEADLNCEHYRLSGLDVAAWKEFFNSRNLEVCEETLVKLHHTYGGNAKAMGILCGTIREDYDGDLVSYWQENSHDPLIETDLKNLISSQFDRLQNIDPKAYNLLCRLGCYRYQDIPTVSRAGLLSLLWDVEERKARGVIASLRNRSLIECDRGEYWLHPAIKAEAMSRLQPLATDWQKVHQVIGNFYTESIAIINNIDDGLMALEAYYYYLVIADFNGAAKVILHSRNNQWGQYLTLGTTLYRLGLWQPLLSAILQIVDRVTDDRIRSELNNILGDLYWISGRVRDAISCQQRTIETTEKCLSAIDCSAITEHDLYYWRMLRVDSLLSIGLYKIDLGELAEAATFFQQVIDLAADTKHNSWSEKAEICLSLVNSSLAPTTKPQAIANFIYNAIAKQKNERYNTGRFAYFIQILGWTFLNLGEISQAREMFEKAISFSQASHYTQIKANSLTGLAIIARCDRDFNVAIEFHQQAIDLLDNIGAKCDLAEACLQLGITYEEAKQNINSQQYLDRAFNLFQQIEAPQQIAKILSIRDRLSGKNGKTK